AEGGGGGIPMMQLRELSKRFGDLMAVDGVSLEVKRGEIFGFLGPNGAGKTTTIKMLAGLIKPSSGRVIIDGWDLEECPREAKKAVGFIPDRPFLYEKLTAHEFLRFLAGLYGCPADGTDERMTWLLRLFGIEEWKDELIESFSHGMKQRLVMISAFLHQPKIIIVDEPMVGLDPAGARLVKEVFRSFASRGGAVFMSTHTLEVAEEVCDRIAIIHGGRIVASGTIDELRQKAGSEGVKLETLFFKLTGGEEERRLAESMQF
ncbi:MAG: transporter-related protein, partial [Deltaproteobacteria bacterium]|nr:transporter-related protein [Deltaproteobacteria bacterium]